MAEETKAKVNIPDADRMRLAQRRAALESMEHKPVQQPPEWMRGIGEHFGKRLSGLAHDPVGLLRSDAQEGLARLERSINSEDPNAFVGFALDNTFPVKGLAGIIGKYTPPADLSTRAKVALMRAKLDADPKKWEDLHVHDPVTGRNHFFDIYGTALTEFPDVTRGISRYIRRENDRVAHPDLYVEDRLAGIEHIPNAHYMSKSPAFSPGNGKEGPRIWNPSVAKQHAYTSSTKEGKSIESLPEGERYAKRMELYDRVAAINAQRDRLANAFTASKLAHESGHALAYLDELPSGSSLSRSMWRQLEKSDPKQLEELLADYKRAVEQFGTDDLRTAVALVKLNAPPDLLKKYLGIDMQYQYGSPERFNVIKPNVLITELINDSLRGRIDPRGTPLESLVDLRKAGLKTYKDSWGEAYSRIAEKRAAEAMLKGPDVYKTNPQSYLDVNPNDLYREYYSVESTLPKKLSKGGKTVLPDSYKPGGRSSLI